MSVLQSNTKRFAKIVRDEEERQDEQRFPRSRYNAARWPTSVYCIKAGQVYGGVAEGQACCQD